MHSYMYSLAIWKTKTKIIILKTVILCSCLTLVSGPTSSNYYQFVSFHCVFMNNSATQNNVNVCKWGSGAGSVWGCKTATCNRHTDAHLSHLIIKQSMAFLIKITLRKSQCLYSKGATDQINWTNLFVLIWIFTKLKHNYCHPVPVRFL